MAERSGLAALLGSTVFRLVGLYVSVLIAAACLFALALLWQINTVMTREALLAVERERADLSALHQRGGVVALAAELTRRGSSSGSTRFVLQAADGRVLAGAAGDAALAEAVPRPAEGRVLVRSGEASSSVGPGYDFARRWQLPDGTSLTILRDITGQWRLVERLRAWLIAGFLVLLALGLGGAALLSHRLLGRLNAIAAASRAIMAGDLARRVPVSAADDEMDALAHSLNTMLDRIEQLMGGLREVSDNIAHDLKTPLNRLRNRAEAALREGAAGADAGSNLALQRAALERVIDDADELIKTFNALLAVARLEAGAIADAQAQFDLSAFLGELAELYGPATEDAGGRLTAELPTALAFNGHRQLIGQAVANLLDNALKYGAATSVPANGAPAGADITLGLTAGADHVEITVADRGAGIAPADRDRAVRRFSRLDASRSRPGFGIGLSLVAAVARLHGGGLQLDDNRPGLIARLRLPRTAAEGPV